MSRDIIFIDIRVSPRIDGLELPHDLAALGMLRELRLSVVEHAELLLEVLLVILISVLVGHEEFVSFLLGVESIYETFRI